MIYQSKPVNETLEQAEKRVLKRTTKHWLMTGTCTVVTTSGLTYSLMQLASSNVLTQAQTNHDNVVFGLLAGTLSLAFGGATLIPLGIKLAKDHDSLQRIETSKQKRQKFEPNLVSANYRTEDETGQPETFGSAYSRVKTRLNAKFAGAVSGTILSLSSLADAFTNNPVLSRPLSMLLDDLTTSRNLATILQAMPIPTASGLLATWCLATLSRDVGKLREITVEADRAGGMDKRPSFASGSQRSVSKELK
jgi:hypothetical protein